MAAPAPTPVLDNCYLHYTSREGAQGIAASGLMRPGRSGYVYLTKDLYAFGADAANRLSIINKPAELACLIDGDTLPQKPSPPPEGPIAEPIRDDEGNLVREGGGSQFVMSASLSVPKDKELWLGLLQP